MRPNKTALAVTIVCVWTAGLQAQGLHADHSQAARQGWTRGAQTNSGGYPGSSNQTISANYSGVQNNAGTHQATPGASRAVVTASAQAQVPGDGRSEVPSGQLASTQDRSVQDTNARQLTPISSKAREDTSAKKSGGVIGTLVSIISSLAIVVGLFFGLVWVYRKTANQSAGSSLPKDVVRILGRTPIAARQQMVLLHFGSKLVLVSVVQGDARTISEITDPEEVQRLSGMCDGPAQGSSSESFRSFLAQGATK